MGVRGAMLLKLKAKPIVSASTQVECVDHAVVHSYLLALLRPSRRIKDFSVGLMEGFQLYMSVGALPR